MSTCTKKKKTYIGPVSGRGGAGGGKVQVFLGALAEEASRCRIRHNFLSDLDRSLLAVGIIFIPLLLRSHVLSCFSTKGDCDQGRSCT